MTWGNVSRVTVTICALPPSAAASCSDLEPLPSSIATTVPGTDSNCDTVARSCESSARRSVTTTTLSNTLVSASSCRSDSRWASQPIEFDLPEPAECCTRYVCPGPRDRASAAGRDTESHLAVELGHVVTGGGHEHVEVDRPVPVHDPVAQSDRVGPRDLRMGRLQLV